MSNNNSELGYTLGLIAGEGSFFVTFVEDDRYSHGLWFSPKVAVSMGAKSKEMLEHQCEMYDLGTVNPSQKGHQWVLSSREDCHQLRRLIDEYLDQHEDAAFLRTPKYEAYQSWSDALELLQPGRSLSKEEVVKLAEIRDEINYIRASGHTTTEEIKRILGLE